MRISERGQITIPRHLREQCGFNHKVDVELTPTDRGLLIHKRTSAQHPVDAVFGTLAQNESTDSYIEEIRGR